MDQQEMDVMSISAQTDLAIVTFVGTRTDLSSHILDSNIIADSKISTDSEFESQESSLVCDESCEDSHDEEQLIEMSVIVEFEKLKSCYADVCSVVLMLISTNVLNMELT